MNISINKILNKLEGSKLIFCKILTYFQWHQHSWQWLDCFQILSIMHKEVSVSTKISSNDYLENDPNKT